MENLNVTLVNTMLANTLRDALIENASNGKFKSLLRIVLESPNFRKALNAASVLFGEKARVNFVSSKKRVKKATKRASKKAAKVADPNAPKPKRGRPKGSKNKPKGSVAESRPAIPTTENEGLRITDMELASETV